MKSRSLLSFGILSAACLCLGPASFAEESLAPPEPHPLCLQPPVEPTITSERILSRWPDGSVKAKQIDLEDGTYIQVHFHENGQKELETHHAVVPIDGDPRKRQHIKRGTEKRWHANGQLFVCAVYENNLKTGTWIYNEADGNSASAFTYEEDREVEHLTYSRVFGWQPFQGK